MPIKKLLSKLRQSKTSNTVIPFCKLCFKDLKIDSFFALVNRKHNICNKCASQFKPCFSNFTLDGIKGVSIYNYDEHIKSLLFQLKGCGDYEIASAFLHRLSLILRFQYLGYILVPAPSFEAHNEKRGFNHVQAIFESLNLKIHLCFKKTEDRKQSNLTSKEREKIGNYLTIESGEFLKNRKILIVDDVMTTGSTLKAMIKELRKQNPRKIKILILSRVPAKIIQ